MICGQTLTPRAAPDRRVDTPTACPDRNPDLADPADSFPASPGQAAQTQPCKDDLLGAQVGAGHVFMQGLIKDLQA